jgi:diaminohydroxyphosphoribosylaminopyrimidine deaminase / 5-amino-6-(5-phosphoribosylamino)uracil reductase
MASQSETAAMRRALDLAAGADVPRGPNPRVGAVVLAPDGSVVGEGVHRGAGTPHAEVAALAAAQPLAAGATVVVTLEPCNHTGRTGPCVDALIAAGVARVVYAQGDANPVAAGGGDRLRAAGVAVEGGVLVDEAVALNPTWTFAVAHGRPYVTWKTAGTLDGRAAAADGTSRWITGPAARADVHALRATVDAVLVGTGTVLADDPRLTARLGGSDGPDLPREQQPLRVVVGTRPVPPDRHVLDDAAPSLVLATRDLDAVLATLTRADVQHVLLEGGPTLAGAFVAAGLVDRVVAYVAPALLGTGSPVLAGAGISTVAEALRLRTVDVTRLGDDVRITAVRREG